MFLGSVSVPRLAGGGGPLPNEGKYRIYRKSDKPGQRDDLEVSFSVHKFKPLAESDKREVVILLESIAMKLPRHVDEWTLVLDWSMGSGKESSKFAFSQKISNRKAWIDDVIGIHGKKLHTGKWNVGVPFHFSLSLVEKKELEALEGLIEDMGTQAKRFTEKDPVEEHIDNATIAAQSVRSLVTEFLADKISVGVKSGLITAQQTIAGGGFDGLSNFVQVPSIEAGHDFEVELQSVNGGQATVKLRIERVALKIKPTPLAEGFLKKDYEAQLQATSSIEPLTWSWNGRTPPGLTLSQRGAITGKPSQTSVFTFSVNVSDSTQPNSQSDTKTFSITIS